MASEKKTFECFFFFFVFSFVFFLENLAFRLSCPPIKISDLDKMYMVGKGLLQKPVKLLSKYLQ